jgi:hypothetical protein
MRYLTIFPLFICLLSLPLQAAEYKGLYEAEVEVPNQGAGARSEGMRQAMAAVLLKVSGAGRVRDDASLAEAMQQPDRYVQQYRYRSDASPQGQQSSTKGGRQKESLLLSVRFDQRSIDELLRQSGFNVWGEARPSTLIWLGVEDGGTRVMVGANDSGRVREIIDSEAARRALPIKLPLLDMTDQGKVRPADVWGEFIDTIKKASQRYAPQAILVGRLYPVSGRRWEVRWLLDYRGEVSRWQSQSGEVAPLIAEAIDRVTDDLASHFAQGSVSGSGEVLMRVEGIRNLKDYRRVVDYLEAVHGVKQVVVDTMTPTAARLRIVAEGGMDTVLRIIALGNTLVKMEQPGTEMRLRSQVLLRSEGDKGVNNLSSGDKTLESAEMTRVAEPPPPELVYRLIP